MARVVSPHELQPHLSQLISAKKQIGPLTIDLTVQKVFKMKKGGKVDFGGSEWEEAQWVPLPPVKLQASDAYGWWELAGDTYLVAFNETLQFGENQIGFLQPHPRLISSGATLIPMWVQKMDKSFRATLLVARNGIHIKENARIAQLLVVEMDNPIF